MHGAVPLKETIEAMLRRGPSYAAPQDDAEKMEQLTAAVEDLGAAVVRLAEAVDELAAGDAERQLRLEDDIRRGLSEAI
jgi:hypothetical protein